jgi:Tol biopolymer transport system component
VNVAQTIHRGRCLLVALLVLVVSGGPASAQGAGTPVPTTAAPSGRIAFSEEDDVWVVGADGSGLTRLTSEEGPEFDPAWSPDGRRIAYRDSRRGINNDDEIYLMDADGANPTNLTKHPANDWSPAWSPDGNRIAFASDRDGGFPRLYLINPDGSGLVALTEGWGEYPSWSSDGRRIAYSCYQGGGSATSRPDYDVCAIDAAGSGEANLTGTPAYDGYPAWSPDGATIAFTSERDSCPDGKVTESEEACEDGSAVYLMAPDGSDVRRLTEPAVGSVEFPAWSPDGRFLVGGRKGVVTIVALDGSIVAALGPGQFADWTAASEP